MKKIILNTLGQVARNNLTWKLVQPIVKTGLFLDFKRLEFNRSREFEKDNFNRLFDKKEVLNGPFKGMKYPSLASSGSTLYPKLIGCYEKELHELIESMCKINYTNIIDIGCAEGYYAIGFAMRIPGAKVYAYDTDGVAREQCLGMAKLNKVENRVEVRAFCSAEELRDFKFDGRGLVICDCEGYELNLFNGSNLSNLSGCDVLIETHDMIDINISTELYKLFSKTHDITVIKSIDDIEKAKTYKYAEADGLDLVSRKKLFAEGRQAIMEWLYCKPKTS
jgi:hypothetical protein